MFGSFVDNFGLNFSFEAQNPAVAPQAPGANGLTAAPLNPSQDAGGSLAAGVAGQPSSPTTPSPLASPLGPGQATQAAVGAVQPNPAPAAGVGSQFARSM